MAPSLTKDRYPTVLDWARWHFGVVSREELGALGIPPGTIASWLACGRLQRLHMGVFAVGHTALPRAGRWRAAILTTGPHAALSHHTGMLALGHRVPEHDGLHLTTPRAGRSRDALHVHRSPLAAIDVTLRGGLRVTRRERTLVDLADLLTWPELATVADRLWEIDAACSSSAKSPTRSRSSSAPSSASSTATGSPVRRRSTSGIDRYTVDAVYADAPLAIELDGRAYHARRREMKLDRNRDADLQILGYRVLRLVWEDLYDEQAPETIRRLTKLLGLRGA